MTNAIKLISLLTAEASRLVISAADIEDIFTFRVSSKAFSLLQNQLGAAEAAYRDAHGAVVDWLRDNTALLMDKTSDKRLRAEGIIKVTEGDLASSHTSNARVGYFAFVPIGDDRWALVLLVANSAQKRVIPTPDSPRGLSAWAQMVVWSWVWARTALRLWFVRDGRMARNLEVFATIDGAVKERPGARYFWGMDEIDPRTDSWRAVIGANRSAEEATTTVAKLTGGRAVHLKAGLWASKEEYLPLGLHLPTVIDPATGKTTTSKRPQIDPDTQEMAQRMWERNAAGADMVEIAVEEASRGARNTHGTLLAFKVAPLMSDAQMARTRDLCESLSTDESSALRTALDHAGAKLTHAQRTSCRRAANEFAKRCFQYLDFYRHGRLVKTFTNPRPGTVSIDHHPFTFLIGEDDTPPEGADPAHVFTVAEFREHFPDHAIWRTEADNAERFETMCRVGFLSIPMEDLPRPVSMTEQQWEAAEDNIPTGWLEQRRSGHRKTQSNPTAPLSQLHGITEEGEAWRIWKDHGRYVLLTGEAGQPVSAMRRVACVPCDALHQQLGEQLISLAEQSESVDEPLPILDPSHAPSTSDPVADAQRTHDGLLNEIDRLEFKLHQATDKQNELDTSVRSQARLHASLQSNIDEYNDRLDEIEDVELPAAVQELAAREHDGSAQDEEAEPLEVDANPLVFVGARFKKLAAEAQHIDIPLLAESVAWLFDGGQLLTPRLGEGRDLHLDVRVRVPGRDIPHVLTAGTITLTSRAGRIRGRATDPTLPSLPEEAARWTFAHQKADAFVAQHDWTHAFLVESLRDWLQDRDLAPGACNAIIDAALADDDAIPVAPTVYAWLTANGTTSDRMNAARQAAAAHNAETLADPIIDAYIRQSDSWPDRATGWTRSCFDVERDLIALLNGQARDRTRRQDVADALGRDRTELRNVVARYRPHQIVNSDNRHLWIRQCQRLGCDGRMTHIVPFPETMLMHGRDGDLMACDACHRPSGSYWDNRPLTPVYLRLWTAPAASVNMQRPEAVSVIADPPDLAQVQLPKVTFTMGTTAKKLGIGHRSVRTLIDDGVLRTVPVRNNRGGYRIPASELARPEVLQAVDQIKARRWP